MKKYKYIRQTDFQKFVLKSLSNQEGVTFDPTQISANLIKLEVYYAELTNTIIAESPGYPVGTSLHFFLKASYAACQHGLEIELHSETYDVS